MERIPSRKAREQFAQILGGTRRVLITSHGLDVAAVVGPTDAKVLEWLDQTGRMDEIVELMRAGQHPVS